MNDTPIEWTDMTVNPILARRRGLPVWDGKGSVLGRGAAGHYCEKISPGCKNCYASDQQPRFGLPKFQDARGEDAPEVYFEPRRLGQMLRRRKPARIFWCDMTDMFGRWVPNEWIAACFGVMAATPQHTHQVLTKRADRMVEWFRWAKEQTRGYWHHEHGMLWEHLERLAPTVGTAAAWEAMYKAAHGSETATRLGDVGASFRWPLPNVHLGVSVESPEYLSRVDDLMRCPAVVRWASFEPLLADLGDVSRYLKPTLVINDGRRLQHPDPAVPSTGGTWERGLDWAVIGGESGHASRPFDLAWGRSLIDQFKSAGVPVFVKQLGTQPELRREIEDKSGKPLISRNRLLTRHRKGGDPSEWPEDLRVREMPR